MDATLFQSRAMDRLGEFPTERDLQAALSGLIGEVTALRSLLSLDGDRLLEDDDVTSHLGSLLVRVAEAACALGVDLAAAMQRGADDADARTLARIARIESRRLAQGARS